MAFLEDNIESRPLWKPMHLQPVFADAPYYGGDVAEKLFDNGLCLPSGSNLTDEERQRIALKIKEVFDMDVELCGNIFFNDDFLISTEPKKKIN